MRTAPGIPSSGRGPCAWSGIIRGQSQAFDKSLHGFWYGNSRVALFVGLPFYNTVVLVSGAATLVAAVKAPQDGIEGSQSGDERGSLERLSGMGLNGTPESINRPRIAHPQQRA